MTAKLTAWPLKGFKLSHSAILGVVLFVATVLRFYQIGAEAIWVDEVYSIRDINSFEIADPGPRPLYFLMLWGWSTFNAGDVWLRTLGVLFSIATTYLVYQLGYRLLDRKIGLLAAAMFAISPLMVNHAQEVRMYSLALFLTAAGTLALTQNLDRIHPVSFHLWWVLRWLGTLAFPPCVLMLVADGIVVLMEYRGRWKEFFQFFAAAIVSVLLWLPVVFLSLISNSQEFANDQTQWIPSDSNLLVSVVSKITSFSLFWPLQDLSDSPALLTFYKGMTLLLLGLLGIALWQLIRRQPPSRGLLWTLILLAVPSALVLFASEAFMSGTIWRARYILFVAPYLFLSMAYGFVQLWTWHRLPAVVLAALYLVAAAIGLEYYYSETYRDDWYGVVRLLEAREQPGDALVYYAPWAEFSPLPRYYEGDLDIRLVDQPPNRDEPEGLETVLAEVDLDDESPTRLWLVCWQACGDGEIRDAIHQELLGEGARVEEDWRFKPPSQHRLEVELVVPGNS